jgi:beta-glucanase (GH16 family)
MRLLIVGLLLAGVGTATGLVAATGGAASFSDFFPGSSLSSAWIRVVGANPSNGEEECYSSSDDTVNRGVLTESAEIGSVANCYCPPEPASTAPCPYTSGAVQWRSLGFTYGTVTVRAKLAGGVGTWPAIWLLGTNCQSPEWIDAGAKCDWPAPGANEIDIAEHVPGTSFVTEQVHTEGSSGTEVSPGCQEPTNTCPSNAAGWHTYTLIWTPGSLKWQIDGHDTYTLREDVPSTSMFLIINTAVGASDLAVDAATLPQTTRIAYVDVTGAQEVTP